MGLRGEEINVSVRDFDLMEFLVCVLVCSSRRRDIVSSLYNLIELKKYYVSSILLFET